MVISINEKAVLIPKVGNPAIQLSSIIPILYRQDFTNNPVVNNWLKVLRLSSGSYFDQNLEVRVAANDIARFDYIRDIASNTNKCRGLLVEKQKTNFLPRQIAFENMSGSNCAMSVLSTSIGDLVWKRLTGKRVDNDIDRAMDNDKGFISEIGSNLCVSALFRQGTTGRASLGFYLADANNNGIYPKIRYFFDESSADVSTGAGWEVATSFRRRKIVGNIWNCQVNIDTTKRANIVQMRPFFGPYTKEVDTYVDIAVAQSEVGYASSFIWGSAYSTVTRDSDKLRLNLDNYTGTVKITYERQDSNIIETKFIDLVNQTLPVLSNYLDIGVWIKDLTVYARLLTDTEKLNLLNLNLDQNYSFSIFDANLIENIKVNRLSRATLLNQNGLMHEVDIDVARIDHTWDGVSWAKKGLLVEKQATNLIGNSDYADSKGIVSWNSTDANITTSRNPDGTFYIEGKTAGTDRPVFSQSQSYRILTAAANSDLSISLYCNASRTINYNYVMRDGVGNSIIGTFANKVTTNKSENAMTSRANLTYTLQTAVTNGYMLFGINVVNSWVNAGYPQVEMGNYSTSWIRTSTSAVTRAADNPYFKNGNSRNVTATVFYEFINQKDNTTQKRFVDVTNAVPAIKHSDFESGHIRRLLTFNRALTEAEKGAIQNAI